MSMMIHRNKKARAAKKAALLNENKKVEVKSVPEIPLEEKQEIEETKQENHVKHFTKSEIMRMSTSELQSLGTQVGITNANQINGYELKKMLIKKFEL